MDLRITPAQVEKLTDLDVSSLFIGGVIRPSVYRSTWRLLSLLVTEFSVMAVLFIICTGIGLVVIRSWPDLGSPVLLVGVAGGLVITGAIAWHGYQWARYKTFLSLSRLLDEVDRHNDIVQAVQVMDELGAVQGSALPLPNRAEVMAALQATRDSLILALRAEKILRRHQALIQRRQELFSSIETNLATLQALPVNTQATEYRQFLQEALEIGLAVQQEMEPKKPH